MLRGSCPSSAQATILVQLPCHGLTSLLYRGLDTYLFGSAAAWFTDFFSDALRLARSSHQADSSAVSYKTFACTVYQADTILCLIVFLDATYFGITFREVKSPPAITPPVIRLTPPPPCRSIFFPPDNVRKKLCWFVPRCVYDTWMALHPAYGSDIACAKRTLQTSCIKRPPINTSWLPGEIRVSKLHDLTLASHLTFLLSTPFPTLTFQKTLSHDFNLSSLWGFKNKMREVPPPPPLKEPPPPFPSQFGGGSPSQLDDKNPPPSKKGAPTLSNRSQSLRCIQFVGFWAHKICGALGFYNLWGLGFVKFMGP